MTAEAPTTEVRNAEFKQRFIAMLTDLQDTAAEDGEAIALIGHLASDLSSNLQQENWSSAKKVVTPQVYNDLLTVFQQRGNEYHQAGKAKHAYAIQALAMSLVSGTMRADQQMAQGEKILDSLIDHSVGVYRSLNPVKPN
ncbi:hypothetical protein [Devosia sp.]|uniref:hypothetical protein n=1 Tax=Devosia sp. TaxID=1871048 RepID=UPI001B2B3F39|nr:hypothetical protein [Devosia sp.]MBO9587465.1 hypothetical protein [Devosia sp.]